MNLKLCKIWFDMGEYGRMSKILKELHKSCQKEDGSDDQKKGTQLLEVYAIEIQIQMYTETKNNKKLKQLYQKALSIESAILHPRIMGIIRECGGKMHMAERQWAEAATDFFEAFKNYDEAGNHRRIQCLKYLVLANMLMESKVNPFYGQEAKPYRNDPEVLAMTNLIVAYQRNEILEFEKILKTNRRTIMDDPFICYYIEDLLKNVRFLKLIKPYTRIRIPSISKGKGMERRVFSTQYTKPLNPPAIAFSTKDGQAMLSEAIAEGTASGSLKLIENFGMQRNLNFCGPASLCTTLNALRVDPKRAWKGRNLRNKIVGFLETLVGGFCSTNVSELGGFCSMTMNLRELSGPWRWYEDHMVGNWEIMEKVQKNGISFDCLAQLASKHADVEPFKAQHSSLEQFTNCVMQTTSTEELYMILSYSRKAVNQTGDGHFSPMAAYHKGRDMLLILDVACLNTLFTGCRG